ncbi:lysophospholipase [Paenibacillus sp. CMAA1364]
MLRRNSFTFINKHGMSLHMYEWLPEGSSPIKGIIQIVHGMAETADRYSRVASSLCDSGYAVYAHDQRGHGKSAINLQRLGDCGKDAFNGMMNDILEITAMIKDKYNGLSLYLLGHSMGSFLVQRIMQQHGDTFSGYILSGSNGPQPNLSVGKYFAQFLMRIQGPSHHSLLLNTVIFGRYNRRVSPVRTAFDWLSRDEKEVDMYIQDPYCGEICTASFFRDFFHFLLDIQKPSHYSNIPKDKPIYLFAGDQDPVGNYGKGIPRLQQIYDNLGIHDVECHLYPGGRHEMLNEINRDEVTSNLLDWLDRHLSS